MPVKDLVDKLKRAVSNEAIPSEEFKQEWTAKWHGRGEEAWIWYNEMSSEERKSWFAESGQKSQLGAFKKGMPFWAHWATGGTILGMPEINLKMDRKTFFKYYHELGERYGTKEQDRLVNRFIDPDPNVPQRRKLSNLQERVIRERNRRETKAFNRYHMLATEKDGSINVDMETFLTWFRRISLDEQEQWLGEKDPSEISVIGEETRREAKAWKRFRELAVEEDGSLYVDEVTFLTWFRRISLDEQEALISEKQLSY